MAQLLMDAQLILFQAQLNSQHCNKCTAKKLETLVEEVGKLANKHGVSSSADQNGQQQKQQQQFDRVGFQQLCEPLHASFSAQSFEV